MPRVSDAVTLARPERGGILLCKVADGPVNHTGVAPIHIAVVGLREQRRREAEEAQRMAAQRREQELREKAAAAERAKREVCGLCMTRPLLELVADDIVVFFSFGAVCAKPCGVLC